MMHSLNTEGEYEINNSSQLNQVNHDNALNEAADSDPSLLDDQQPSNTGSASDVPAEREAQRQEWFRELEKTEEEIRSLKLVLASKLQRSRELKTKLGLNPIGQIKQDLTTRLRHVQDNPTYQRTNEVLSTAARRAGDGLKSTTQTVGHRLSEVKNTPAMKSFGEKMGAGWHNIKYYSFAGLSAMRSRYSIKN